MRTLPGKQPEELEEMKMQYHARDMVFFTPEARQYYIPGWMRLAIKAPDADYADTVIRILGSARGWDNCHGYTAAQKGAIVGFLTFVKARCEDDSSLEFEIAWMHGRNPYCKKSHPCHNDASIADHDCQSEIGHAVC